MSPEFDNTLHWIFSHRVLSCHCFMMTLFIGCLFLLRLSCDWIMVKPCSGFSFLLMLSCSWIIMTLCIGSLFPLMLSCHCFMMTLCIDCLFPVVLSFHCIMMTHCTGCLFLLLLPCHSSMMTLYVSLSSASFTGKLNGKRACFSSFQLGGWIFIKVFILIFARTDRGSVSDIFQLV